MRKTLFLSDAKATPESPAHKYAVPYIFYDRSRSKWYEDTVCCNDLEETKKVYKGLGYLIK